jgi:hypothetical protein
MPYYMLSDDEVAALRAIVAWRNGGIRGQGVQDGPTGVVIKAQRSPEAPQTTPSIVVMIAQLTVQDDDDDTLYAWSESMKTETGFQLVSNGQTGTLGDLPQFPAIDIRDDESRYDLTDSNVLMLKGYYTRSEPDGSGGSVIKPAPCWYIASYPESVGSLSGQVKQMGFGQNRAIWQMIQSNPPLT